MIRIAISQAAFDAIASTLPLWLGEACRQTQLKLWHDPREHFATHRDVLG
jgi:hypothetical protein